MATFSSGPTEIIDKCKQLVLKLKKPLPLPPVSPMGVFLFALTVLCGRATLFGTLRPFGGAFFAAVCTKRRGYVYMLAAVLGQIWAGAAIYQTGKYIFAMTFFALVIDRLPSSAAKKPFVRGGLFAFSLTVSGLCFTLTSSGGVALSTFYDVMLLFIECIGAACAAGAFCIAVPVLKKMKLSYRFSTADEISLVSLIGCALWGAKDISQIGIINLSDVACIFVVLTFAIRLGSARGAVAGLTMGLVSALGSGRVDITSVSFAFSGLAAGLLGGYGAITGCCGFIFANALITALANGSTEVLINLHDILMACFIYSIIPEKVFLRLTSFGTRDERDHIAEDERFYSEYVLSNAGRVVNGLAVRSDKLREKRHAKNEATLKFYERLARRACTGCGMRRVCWQRDSKKTTATLGCALTDFCDTGRLDEALLPENCLRPRDMRDAFLQMSDMYRSDIIWQGKLDEVARASHNQFFAFSEILKAAAASLSSYQRFDRALSDDISRKMEEGGIACRNVVVLRDEDFDPTVMLTMENCGGFSMCEKGAEEIISAACGQRMVRCGKKDCRSCRIKYTVMPKSKMNFATARKARGRRKISGDSAAVRVINKNLYAAVLTDGMGYGEKAAFEARGTAETILDLIEIGLDGESALKIANSLLLPYGEATFSATDLCLYDVAEGRARIIKCGGAASFTKSGERVDALYSKSMPLGSIVKENFETFTLSAQTGDIIVMISDGVLESSAKGALKDAWLINELEKFSGNDPSMLANLIADKAMEKCAMEPRDDITVLAAYIE